MSKEKKESYESSKKENAPYNCLFDDRLRWLKPRNDLEYAIGKFVNESLKVLFRLRKAKERSKRSFKGKMVHKTVDKLKIRKLKIRDNSSTFRAVLKILTEDTSS
jgi:hypothetical protein